MTKMTKLLLIAGTASVMAATAALLSGAALRPHAMEAGLSGLCLLVAGLSGPRR